jgi:hypothetical protein
MAKEKCWKCLGISHILVHFFHISIICNTSKVRLIQISTYIALDLKISGELAINSPILNLSGKEEIFCSKGVAT